MNRPNPGKLAKFHCLDRKTPLKPNRKLGLEISSVTNIRPKAPSRASAGSLRL